MVGAKLFFCADLKDMKIPCGVNADIAKRWKRITSSSDLNSLQLGNSMKMKLLLPFKNCYRMELSLTRSLLGMMTRQLVRCAPSRWRDDSFHMMWLLWVSTTFPSPATC